jgi:diguanylate cyclase (GGDEF)-like protein
MSRTSVAAVPLARRPFGADSPAAAPRVLVVEDERIVAADLQRMLRQLGYDAYAAASTARKALDLAADRPPDVVLADIRIEGPVDGIDAAFKLRQQYGTAIVFLTAHADDPTVERAKRAEPSGYLVKPVSAPAMKAAVELALDRREREAATRALEYSLMETSAGLLGALNHLLLAVQLEDTEGRVIHTNPAFRAMFGLPEKGAGLVGVESELLMRHVLSQCADPDWVARIMDSLRHSHQPMTGDVVSLLDGRLLELDFIPVHQGSGRQGQMWTYRDVSATERTLEELEQSAARDRQDVLLDSLTRLASRRGFFELAPTYARLLRSSHGRKKIILFADLDNLKRINDRYGHTAGDDAICGLAQALQRTFRTSDLIARFGGDEFVVLASLSPDEVASVADRINANLPALSCIRLPGAAPLSVSVGLVEYGADVSLRDLISLADAEMYRAKQRKLTPSSATDR